MVGYVGGRGVNFGGEDAVTDRYHARLVRLRHPPLELVDGYFHPREIVEFAVFASGGEDGLATAALANQRRT
ncbi:MAG: hypothetical protein GEU97_09105 [Actinophytocola sp.]|nr:hypothetical protein [Actinophytocola sp.]